MNMDQHADASRTDAHLAQTETDQPGLPWRVIGTTQSAQVEDPDGTLRAISCCEEVGRFATEKEADQAAVRWVDQAVRENYRAGEETVNVWRAQRLIRTRWDEPRLFFRADSYGPTPGGNALADRALAGLAPERGASSGEPEMWGAAADDVVLSDGQRRCIASMDAGDLGWIAGAVEDLDLNGWTRSNEAWFEAVNEAFSPADVAAVRAWVRRGKPVIAETA